MSDVVTELAAAARAGGRLGIDTEFMGERRYRPLLCLVQVSVADAGVDGGVRVEVLDTLDERVDPGPLAEVLADPEIEVVTHAGRQDVQILRREWATDIANLFDTQAAAGFAGYSAQASYDGLLHGVLGLRLEKSASFTRWDARPLTPEQVSYAREDVVHLLALAAELQRRLRESGRLDWAREESRLLEEADGDRDPEEAWRRLPRVNQLDARGRAVAQAVAAWRERTAAGLDRPVGFLLSDPALVEIARRRPQDAAGLEQIRGLSPQTLQRRGRAILAAVERGRTAEPPTAEGERVQTDPRDAPLVALAEALVRARSMEAGLAYELLAARADLAAIVRGGATADVRTLKGWRGELVGEELLELLAGRRALAVGGRHIEVRDT